MAIVEELPSTPTRGSGSTTRQRKNKKSNKKSSNIKDDGDIADEIPLKLPPDFLPSTTSTSTSTSSSQAKAKPLIDMDLPENSNLFTLNPGDTISEDQFNEFKSERIPHSDDGAGGVEEEEDDEIFRTLILAIPFTFLYLLLDILVHLQYNHRPSNGGLIKGCLTAFPTLYMIVLYTNRYPNHWLTNPFLISSSILSGCRLIWLVNKASWSVVTSQAPPMGTLWILTIVQLPLSRAVLALAFVGGWIWYQGMKIMP